MTLDVRWIANRRPNQAFGAAVPNRHDCDVPDRYLEAEPYEAINLKNFESVPQIQEIPEELRWDIKVVGSVLPFKSNQYVVEHLIDWDRVPDDPMFRLTFPQRGMLEPKHFERMEAALRRGADASELKATADAIRYQLNPHPAGQLEHNVPTLRGKPLTGIHKYRETRSGTSECRWNGTSRSSARPTARSAGSHAPCAGRACRRHRARCRCWD